MHNEYCVCVRTYTKSCSFFDVAIIMSILSLEGVAINRIEHCSHMRIIINYNYLMLRSEDIRTYS